MLELFAGCAYFVFVFFKAFQQRNVTFDHYKPVLPISYLMSATEIFIVSVVAFRVSHMQSLEELISLAPLVFAVGTGGGLGAMSAMWVHNKIYKEG